MNEDKKLSTEENLKKIEEWLQSDAGKQKVKDGQQLKSNSEKTISEMLLVKPEILKEPFTC